MWWSLYETSESKLQRNATEPGGDGIADVFRCPLGTLVWLRRLLGWSRNARPET